MLLARVTQSELEQVTARVAGATSHAGLRDVAYVGALLFSDDDLVLCLFDGPSRLAVKRASERVGIPCERLMDFIWLGARGPGSDRDPGGDNHRTANRRFRVPDPPSTKGQE